MRRRPKTTIINRLHMCIAERHDCDSLHVQSVPLDLEFRGHPVWNGVVEVFEMIGHRKAKRCYSWIHQAGSQGENVILILEIPPVACPETAVKAFIESHFNQAKK